MSEYLSCAETAKLVRAALKRSFPGVKFSVRSDVYAGGASIRVGWVDGPLAAWVDQVVAPYKGGDFDGMIDMKINKTAWLMPDGTATLAHNPGTTGSMGTIPSAVGLQPSAKSRKVRFGADFIFTNRTYSAGLVGRALASLASRYGFDAAGLKVEEGYFGGQVAGAGTFKVEAAGEYLDILLHRALCKRASAAAVPA
jgi:hypothetical protein